MFQKYLTPILIAMCACHTHADPSSYDAYAAMKCHGFCELDEKLVEDYETLWKELEPLLTKEIANQGEPQKISGKTLKRCFVGGHQLRRISERLHEMGDSSSIDAKSKSDYLIDNCSVLATIFLSTQKGQQERARCEALLEKSQKRYKSDVDKATKLFAVDKFEEGEKIVFNALDHANDSLIMLPRDRWSKFRAIFREPLKTLTEYSKTRSKQNTERLDQLQKTQVVDVECVR